MKEESRLLSGICKKKLALIYTFKFRNSEDIYFKNWNVRTTVSGSALKWLRTPHFRTFILLAVFGARWFWCHLRMITTVIWHFIVWKLPKLTYLGLTAFTSLHFTHDFTFTFHLHALEKEMATHSSVLAWRIPGTGEPGGLPSIWSHRVGHDWSELAVAAGLTVR